MTARGGRKLRNEEYHNFYVSPNIIRVIKLRKVRWAGHVAYMGRTNVGMKAEWKEPLARPGYRQMRG